ncbi:putative nuclease HARBI1 [Ananas comosus]|uniref:Nuclease HARBI1 n=2 Tax=Ananas comosus TaxID=4615 RepID=A0A6P5EJM7_ANACO|nr:putative nuclease HARBI1 [Ananas comosus]
MDADDARSTSSSSPATQRLNMESFGKNLEDVNDANSTSPTPTLVKVPSQYTDSASAPTSSMKRLRVSPPIPTPTSNRRRKIDDRSEAMSELVQLGRKRTEIAETIMQRELQARPKVHSIEECMERLTTVAHLSPDGLLAACEALKDERNRPIFMTLSGELLYMWIDRQISMQQLLCNPFGNDETKVCRHECYVTHRYVPAAIHSTCILNLASKPAAIYTVSFNFLDSGYKTLLPAPMILFDVMLRDELVGRGFIESTRHLTAEEQLGIFLFGIGHGVANKVLAETFQHSGETISRHFNNVLRGVVALRQEYIQPPASNVGVHPRIIDNSIFHPFKNAIGAIDGTHIPVVVRKSKQPRYRCRKGFTSQNMMAACSFDHQFLFVCTRWEGSAADMRVLRWCCESGGFTVPEGKFYLVDSGYANTDRFLAPYRGERYHLSQFAVNAHARRHRGPKDLYNHRHAQLRNVIEKAFGILKRRFKVLRQATPFPYKVQCRIAIACCVIHNFIKRHQGTDR